MSLLLVLAAPALAAAPISTPVLLPGDATVGPAAGTQDEPALVEGDGTMWLATWRDTRASLAGTLGSDATDVYAIRVDASGAPVDTVAFPVASGPWSEGTPRAAWNGTDWLVAYEGDAASATYWSQGVAARRVSGAGVVLDAEAIGLVDEAYDDEALWDVASDGDGWAVLWQAVDDGLGSYVLDGTTVAADGTAAAARRVYTPASMYGAPWNARLAWSSDRYLAAWSSYGNDDDIEALPLGSDLTALGPVSDVAGDSYSSVQPALAAGLDGFYVTWFDDSFGAYWTTVMGTPVDADGAPAIAGGTSLSGDTWPLDVHPDAAWMGDRWGVAWEYGAAAAIYTSQVDTAGALEGYDNATGAYGYTRAPTVAGGDGQMLLAYATYGDRSDFDVDGLSVDVAGTPGPVSTLSLSAPAQTRPAIAGGTGGYLVVAQSETADDMRILAWRTDTRGVARGTAPIELAVGSSLTDPKVAWNGSVWLVVWTDNDPDTTANGVVGVRVRSNGTVLDATPIALLTGDSPAVAASTGGDFLVAGVLPVTYNTNRLAAVRVSSAGVVLDAAPFTIGANHARDPDISALGTGWIVSWAHFHSHDSGLSEALYSVVSSAGTPTAEAWVRTTGSTGQETGVNVATDGSRALVVWSDSGDVRGRFIDSSGAVTGTGAGFVISAQANEQFEPDVAWNGRSFAVAWTDWRAHDTLEPGEGDVYVTNVSATGRVESTAGTALAVDDTPEGNPAVVGVGNRTVFVWTKLHEESPYAAFRIETAMQGTTRPPATSAVMAPMGEVSSDPAATEEVPASGCATVPAGPMAAAWLAALALAWKRGRA